MTRYQQVQTKAQRLRAQAAEAAEVREALEDPSVVALMVERVRKIGGTFIWGGIGIFAVFTIITVHQFVARDDATMSLEWIGAWFLEPGLISGLLGILIWEGVTSKWRVPTGPWTRIAKWGLLASTLTMNVWMAVKHGDLGGFVAHTVPPLGIVLLTEARIEGLDKLAECVQRAHASAATRRQERIAEQARLAADAARAKDAERADRLADAQTDTRIEVLRSEAGAQVAENAAKATAARTGPVVFGGTVSDRSGPTSQTGPADRSGPFQAVSSDRSADTARTGPQVVPDRSGRPVSARPEPSVQTGPGAQVRQVRKPGPRRSGKASSPRQRTDDDLLQDVEKLAADNGGEPPTKYQLKQTLGIGNERAARLLEQLDPVPVGAPASNGAAAKAGQHE